MAPRKWIEIKQKPSMLPGPAVPGSCLASFHFRWAIHPIRPVQIPLGLVVLDLATFISRGRHPPREPHLHLIVPPLLYRRRDPTRRLVPSPSAKLQFIVGSGGLCGIDGGNRVTCCDVEGSIPVVLVCVMSLQGPARNNGCYLLHFRPECT